MMSIPDITPEGRTSLAFCKTTWGWKISKRSLIVPTFLVTTQSRHRLPQYVASHCGYPSGTSVPYRLLRVAPQQQLV